MKKDEIKKLKREKRTRRVRAKIFGTQERPRLAVFRSLSHISVQLIDDNKGITLVGASDKELKLSGKNSKTETASELGKLLAKKAVEKKITSVVFDRRRYKFHGRIKALADSAKDGGLKF